MCKLGVVLRFLLLAGSSDADGKKLIPLGATRGTELICCGCLDSRDGLTSFSCVVLSKERKLIPLGATDGFLKGGICGGVACSLIFEDDASDEFFWLG